MATVPALITYTFPLLGSPLSNKPSDSITDPSPSFLNHPPSTKPNDTNPDPPTPLTYTHPLPPSLLAPPPPGSPSYPTYQTHLTDILTTLNHLHHTSCLSHLLSVSPVCANPTCPAQATDLLKTATPLLALAEPIIVIACAGYCTSSDCAGVVRGLLTAKTTYKPGGNAWATEEWKNKEGCAVCGRKYGGGMRKCGGCGVVRYCGERCQKRGWKKGHKGECAGMREMGEREKAKGVGGGGGNEEGKGGEEEVGEGGMEDVGDPEDELWEE